MCTHCIMETEGGVIRHGITFPLTDVECVELCPLTFVPSSALKSLEPHNVTFGVGHCPVYRCFFLSSSFARSIRLFYRLLLRLLYLSPQWHLSLGF